MQSTTKENLGISSGEYSPTQEAQTNFLQVLTQNYSKTDKLDLKVSISPRGGKLSAELTLELITLVSSLLSRLKEMPLSLTSSLIIDMSEGSQTGMKGLPFQTGQGGFEQGRNLWVGGPLIGLTPTPNSKESFGTTGLPSYLIRPGGSNELRSPGSISNTEGCF